MLTYCVVAGEVIKEDYDLEYGSDCLEMHVGAVHLGERALVVDDLIATGGTLRAAINLLGNYIIKSFKSTITSSFLHDKLPFC